MAEKITLTMTETVVTTIEVTTEQLAEADLCTHPEDLHEWLSNEIENAEQELFEFIDAFLVEKTSVEVPEREIEIEIAGEVS